MEITNHQQIVDAIKASTALSVEQKASCIDVVQAVAGVPLDSGREDEASIPVSEIITVIVTLSGIFFANNPTVQEIDVWLLAIAPFIGPGAPTSGTIPAFSVGNTTVGPIPFAPK